ncbi:MAG: DUF5050 domain-containing protein, partial [Candidatus Absconditabacteria bacterium]
GEEGGEILSGTTVGEGEELIEDGLIEDDLELNNSQLINILNQQQDYENSLPIDYINYSNGTWLKQLKYKFQNRYGEKVFSGSNVGDVTFFEGEVFYRDNVTNIFYKAKIDGSDIDSQGFPIWSKPYWIFFMKDGYGYYSNRDNGGLYRIRLDGSDIDSMGEQLFEGNFGYIEVIGDNLYFVNGLDERKLYRMNLNSTGFVYEKILDIPYINVQYLDENELYYDNNGINRYILSGDNQGLNIPLSINGRIHKKSGEYLLINNQNDNSIYKYNLTTNLSELYLGQNLRITDIFDGFVYYNYHDGISQIAYRKSLDEDFESGNGELIANMSMSIQKIIGSYIYYVGGNEGKLYRINMETKNIDKLSDLSRPNIFLFENNYIYYSNYRLNINDIYGEYVMNDNVLMGKIDLGKQIDRISINIDSFLPLNTNYEVSIASNETEQLLIGKNNRGYGIRSGRLNLRNDEIKNQIEQYLINGNTIRAKNNTLTQDFIIIGKTLRGEYLLDNISDFYIDQDTELYLVNRNYKNLDKSLLGDNIIELSTFLDDFQGTNSLYYKFNLIGDIEMLKITPVIGTIQIKRYVPNFVFLTGSLLDKKVVDTVTLSFSNDLFTGDLDQKISLLNGDEIISKNTQVVDKNIVEISPIDKWSYDSIYSIQITDLQDVDGSLFSGNFEFNTETAPLYTITSKPTGGNWNNINTWHEGRLPNENDIVYITGKVELDTNPIVKGVLVSTGSTLTNKLNSTRSLTFSDKLQNFGSVLNQGGTNYYMNIVSKGTIENNGVWSASNVYLEGDYALFTGTNMIGGNIVLNKSVVLSGNSLTNGNLNLNGKGLDFGENSIFQIGNISGNGSLIGSGSIIVKGNYNATITGNLNNLTIQGSFSGNFSGNNVIFEGNNYSYNGNLTGTNIHFNGTGGSMAGKIVGNNIGIYSKGLKSLNNTLTLVGEVEIGSGVEIKNSYGNTNSNNGFTIEGKLINNGVINHNTSRAWNNFRMNIKGEIVNNGSICGLGVNIYTGSIENNGSWGASNTVIIGPELMIGGSKEIGGTVVLNNDMVMRETTKIGGWLYMNNNKLLTIEGNKELEVGGLSSNGRFEGEGKLIVRGDLSGATYEVGLEEVELRDPKRGKVVGNNIRILGSGLKYLNNTLTLVGEVEVGSGVEIKNIFSSSNSINGFTIEGRLINNGVITYQSSYSYGWNYYRMNIKGEIVNNGIIGGLGVNIYTGSIENNGSWGASNTVIIGPELKIGGSKEIGGTVVLNNDMVMR